MISESEKVTRKNRIDQQLKAAGWMTQSILAKAFHDELVAQNPNDEPASMLLKRIKKGKGETPTSIGFVIPDMDF